MSQLLEDDDAGAGTDADDAPAQLVPAPGCVKTADAVKPALSRSAPEIKYFLVSA